MPADANTSDGSSPAGDLSATAAATPNVTLPAFTPADAAPWFLRVEALFRLKAITAPAKKADFVIGALPPETFSRLSRWLISRGTDTVLYEELKTEVIRHCEPSPEEKAQKILDLLRMPLGDQRPSDALYELRNLTSILHADGSTTPLDLTLVVWMLRLPLDVRTQITGFANKSDLELATLADSLRGTSKLSLQMTTAAPAVPYDQEDDASEPATAAATQPGRYGPRRPFRDQRFPYRGRGSFNNGYRGSFNNGYRPRHPYCFYHQSFGSKALKCESPCAFPKNA